MKLKYCPHCRKSGKRMEIWQPGSRRFLRNHWFYTVSLESRIAVERTEEKVKCQQKNYYNTNPT